jgi:hypothetical protein
VVAHPDPHVVALSDAAAEVAGVAPDHLRVVATGRCWRSLPTIAGAARRPRRARLCMRSRSRTSPWSRRELVAAKASAEASSRTARQEGRKRAGRRSMGRFPRAGWTDRAQSIRRRPRSPRADEQQRGAGCSSPCCRRALGYAIHPTAALASRGHRGISI